MKKTMTFFLFLMPYIAMANLEDEIEVDGIKGTLYELMRDAVAFPNSHPLKDTLIVEAEGFAVKGIANKMTRADDRLFTGNAFLCKKEDLNLDALKKSHPCAAYESKTYPLRGQARHFFETHKEARSFLFLGSLRDPYILMFLKGLKRFR